MPRYRLTVEYDGGPYRGFQVQAGLPSVQGSLERAIHAFSGEQAVIFAAGRTDTGVHATGQVVHFELAREWPEATVMNALNAHLAKEPIAVLEAALAAADFHARFSAKGRAYLYRILNRRAPPALERGGFQGRPGGEGPQGLRPGRPSRRAMPDRRRILTGRRAALG